MHFICLSQSRSLRHCRQLAAWLTTVILVMPAAASAEPEGAFLSRLDRPNGLDANWSIESYAVRSPILRTAWDQRMVSQPQASGDPLVLSLEPTPEGASKPFVGAEIQRKRRTHFGRYEVVMTPARAEGVISTFFTYTGDYYGDPHDEIDFEFLGRDTHRVWVTRFASGERLPGEWVELGFDAAEAPHLYTFDWLPERIIWYADGREIFRVDASDRSLPVIPGRIFLTIWAGGEAQEDWSGIAAPGTQVAAKYYCVSYRPPESDAPMCSEEEAFATQ